MSYSGEYATASESFFVNLDWQEFANPANTYIVSSEGFYGFEPKKIDGTPIRIASADWIWASSDEAFAKKQNIISDVSYSSGAIKFHATGNEGNAVICGFDAGGNVVWSWLIWCTDGAHHSPTSPQHLPHSVETTTTAPRPSYSPHP